MLKYKFCKQPCNCKYLFKRKRRIWFVPWPDLYMLKQSPEKFINWASRVGEETKAMVKGILESRPHPEQAFKSCRGVLALAKKVGNDRVNQACKRAMSFHSFSYMTVKNILDKGIENLEQEQVSNQESSHIPDHPNIWAYYSL